MLPQCNAVAGVWFPRKKHFECVRFNVISITRGWVGVKFPRKNHYVTLEWLLFTNIEGVAKLFLCGICNMFVHISDIYKTQTDLVCFSIPCHLFNWIIALSRCVFLVRLAVLENDSFLNSHLRLYVSVQVMTKVRGFAKLKKSKKIG